MDTAQRIGTILAVALVVAFCTISDLTRPSEQAELASDLESIAMHIDKFQSSNTAIRIFLATQKDSDRVLSSLKELPFISSLDDDEVSAITGVLSGMAPQTWARELEKQTTLSEEQILQLLEALEPN